MWAALVLCWILAVLIAAFVVGEAARRDATATLARQAETAAA